jgi:hypothetical protein
MRAKRASIDRSSGSAHARLHARRGIPSTNVAHSSTLQSREWRGAAYSSSRQCTQSGRAERTRSATVVDSLGDASRQRWDGRGSGRVAEIEHDIPTRREEALDRSHRQWRATQTVEQDGVARSVGQWTLGWAYCNGHGSGLIGDKSKLGQRFRPMSDVTAPLTRAAPPGEAGRRLELRHAGRATIPR